MPIFLLKDLVKAAVVGISVVVPVLALAQSEKLDVIAEPAITDLKPGYEGIEPINVIVSNRGRDAVGVVHVIGGSYKIDVPIELPRGSTKRFFTYVPRQAMMYGGQRASVVLDTNQGSVEQFYENSMNMDSDSLNVVYIGDQVGSMTFLRQRRAQINDEEEPPRPGFLWDAYVKPGFVPTRAIGFRNVVAIVMGDGSERLKNDEVKAIKNYVMAGGVVVFCGGVSAPVLTDPRWIDLVPIKNARPMTIPTPNLLTKRGRSPISSPTLSALIGTPQNQAEVISESGRALIATTQFGLGKIVFVAVSPFEAPLETWPGRGRFWTSLPLARSDRTVYRYANRRYDDEDMMRRYPGGTPAYPGSYGVDRNDPFRISMPPVSKVVIILLTFVLLAVPVNLLVLRKINRSEWAWWTTPLISLAFAGVFFRFASQLYQATLSNKTEGLLVLDERSENGYFAGYSQLFFPRGGRYDLKLKGTEIIVPMEEAYYGSPTTARRSGMSAMSPIDTDEVRVPNMQVNNLSFQEFGYCGSIDTPKWIESQITVKPAKVNGRLTYRIAGTITNRSRVTISGVLYYKGKSTPTVILEAGRANSIDLTTLDQAYMPDEERALPQNNGLFLQGKTDTSLFGPQIGRLISSDKLNVVVILSKAHIQEGQ